LAEKALGFLAVIHHGNTPKLHRPENNFMSASKPGETRVVFEDDRVHYSGQYVAVVVAETLEQARYAADLVTVSYAVDHPVIETSQALDTAYLPDELFGEKLTSERGDLDAAMSRAAVT